MDVLKPDEKIPNPDMEIASGDPKVGTHGNSVSVAMATGYWLNNKYGTFSTVN